MLGYVEHFSYLLAASSAFASDVYKTTIKRNASDKNVMWVGRIVVIVTSLCTKAPGQEVTDLFDRFKGLKTLEEGDLAE